MSDRQICIRQQQVVPDGTGLGARWTHWCECNGVGCPDDPRKRATPPRKAAGDG